MKKLRSLFSIFLSILLIFSLINVHNVFAASTDKVNVPDVSLRNAILQKIGEDSTYSLTKKDMESFETLSITNNTIVSIEGLQYCTNLRSLDLSNNQINSLTPLTNLDKLVTVKLGNNKIPSIPDLSNMTSLSCLYLNNNIIESVTGLKDLPCLMDLRLDYNKITDLSPMDNIPELTLFEANNNSINNISSLSQFTNLIILNLYHNNITDISPLSELQNLDVNLDLSYNNITDISPLTSLTNLTYLNLSNNKIADLEPLRTLYALDTLDLDSNEIINVEPISTLPNLVSLSLNKNRIWDARPLANLPNADFYFARLDDQNCSAPSTAWVNSTNWRGYPTSYAMTNPILPLTNMTITNVYNGGNYNRSNNVVYAPEGSPYFTYHFKEDIPVGNISASFSGNYRNSNY